MDMAIILVSNPGSSSKKYAFFRGDARVLSVRIETIDGRLCRCVTINREHTHCTQVPVRRYKYALDEALCVARAKGVIETPEDITDAGVRVVAPGAYFMKHRLIDEAFLARLADVADVAPLHVPPTLEECTALIAAVPHARIVGVSDSAFHATLPPHRSSYSVPEAAAHDIRRFGYHGLSVASVARRLPQWCGRMPHRAIVAHVGSGVSVTALLRGESVATSMGYAPASGVLMSSRAADLDPPAVVALMAALQRSPRRMQEYLNTKGGFFGRTGTADMRTILARTSHGDQAAGDALCAFVESVAGAIAHATAMLGGIDALIVSGTAAKRNAALRARLLAPLSFMGIAVDAGKNDLALHNGGIISPEGATPVIVAPSDEEGELHRALTRICRRL